MQDLREHGMSALPMDVEFDYRFVPYTIVWDDDGSPVAVIQRTLTETETAQAARKDEIKELEAGLRQLYRAYTMLLATGASQDEVAGCKADIQATLERLGELEDAGIA
jgi:hypothetical protein